MAEGEKKEKRIVYYASKGEIDFFNLRARIFVGPYRLFDPQALLSTCSKNDREYIFDNFRKRKFKEAYEAIDRLLEGREPFGGEKKYIEFFMWKGKDSKGISKKHNIYRFIQNSVPIFVWKKEMRSRGVDFEFSKDATKIDKYIKTWLIPLITDGSIFSKSMFGNRHGRENDLIRLYVSHKFGWI